MIEISDFSKFYGKKRAVSNFSMKCLDGEITGLIGLNGAGKTTVLKAVCARHFSSGGRVLAAGFDVSENPEEVRRSTGFVQESPDFPKELFVREFLEMRASLFRSGGAEKARELCLLEPIWNEKIGSLSKGQLQRVNFAQALVHDPKILVLDEPASGLDPAQIVRMRKFVRKLKNGHTILLSTHLMQEVESLCDRICVISGGKRVAFGAKDEILSAAKSETLEDAFFILTQEKP